MIYEDVHRQILKSGDAVTKWFRTQKGSHYFPIYSSVDVRDSSFKLASVDANIYPAGFNNICETDRREAPRLFARYIDHVFEFPVRRIGLLTEEHSSNLFYWDNVATLLDLLTATGRDVRVCIPRPMERPTPIRTASGREVMVHSATRKAGELELDGGFVPDIIISNNDFSDSYEWWAKDLQTPVVPARELGWYQRKKSSHFKHYNRLATEFANLIQVDPWIFTVETQLMENFDVSVRDDREALAKRVDEMVTRMKAEYSRRGISTVPTVFIKNNSGTYGLGVTQAHSGQEILAWNAKNRNEMKAAKGGRSVNQVIIQEGIPSSVTADGITAEPVVYMVGCEVIGGFMRAHSSKAPDQSLNSPGAVYKKLCMTDLQVNIDGAPYENVYSWVAKLSLLAIGLEASEMGLAPIQVQPCGH